MRLKTMDQGVIFRKEGWGVTEVRMVIPYEQALQKTVIRCAADLIAPRISISASLFGLLRAFP